MYDRRKPGAPQPESPHFPKRNHSAREVDQQSTQLEYQQTLHGTNGMKSQPDKSQFRRISNRARPGKRAPEPILLPYMPDKPKRVRQDSHLLDDYYQSSQHTDQVAAFSFEDDYYQSPQNTDQAAAFSFEDDYYQSRIVRPEMDYVSSSSNDDYYLPRPASRSRAGSRSVSRSQAHSQPASRSRASTRPAYQPRVRRSKARTNHKLFWLALWVCAFGFVGSAASAYFLLRPMSSPASSTIAPQSPLENQARTNAQDVKALIKDTAQAKIQQFEQVINQVKQNGGEVTNYQQHLDQERAKLATLTKPEDYVALLIRVGTDLSTLQKDRPGNKTATPIIGSDGNANGQTVAARTGNTAQNMLSNYLVDTKQWGDTHKYHDPYDSKNYYLNSSYLVMDGGNDYLYGYGSYMQEAVNKGETDAEQRIEDGYFLHAMLEANYIDETPYNQPHQVDQTLLNYFGATQDHVLLISLTEQAMRIYRNGKLEEAVLVTTGRQHRPTPPGFFQATTHLYNIPFQSGDTPGSPDYYATVMVQNAIQFWDNGYYFHSASWRKDFGPFTNQPHQDSGGNAEANSGSHGCINVPPETLKRLDPTITNATKVIIF
jgi:hypothetical protein